MQRILLLWSKEIDGGCGCVQVGHLVEIWRSLKVSSCINFLAVNVWHQPDVHEAVYQADELLLLLVVWPINEMAALRKLNAFQLHNV